MAARAALKEELRRLTDEVRRVQKLIHEADCAAAGINIGDIVIHRGQEHRVTQVDTWANPPWLRGNPKKKDGTWGKQERHLYKEWSKP